MSSYQGWSRLAGSAGIAALAAVTLYCRPGGTPAPSFGELDGASRSEVLSYAQGLSYDTARGAGDEQPLPMLDSGRVVPGPVVRIEPERGAAYLTRAQLGQGRIIARFRTDTPYSPLRIPAGVSYLWTDSIGGQWRQAIISTNESDPLGIGPLEFEEHSRAYYGARSARGSRWTLNAMGDSIGCNSPCPLGCCCPKGTRLRTTQAQPVGQPNLERPMPPGR